MLINKYLSSIIIILLSFTYSMINLKSINIENNIEIKKANEEVKGAQFKLNEAMSLWLPHIYINARSGYFKNEPNPNSKSDKNIPDYVSSPYKDLYKALILPSDYESYTNSGVLGLTQLLWDSGKAGNSILLAKHNLEMALLNLYSKKQNIQFEANKQYLELISERSNLELNSSYLDYLEKKQQVLKQKLMNQQISKELYEDESINLDIAKIDNKKISVNLQNKKTSFIQFVQNNGDIEINKNTALSAPSIITADVEGLVQLALKNNVEIKKLKLQNDILNTEIYLAQSQNNPSLKFNLQREVKKTQANYQESWKEFDSSTSAWVDYSWNLYDGGEAGNNIEAKKNDIEANKFSIKQLNLDIQNKTTQLFQDYQITNEQLSAISKKLSFKQINIEITRKEFSQLIIDELELLEKEYAFKKIQYEKTALISKLYEIEFELSKFLGDEKW